MPRHWPGPDVATPTQLAISRRLRSKDGAAVRSPLGDRHEDHLPLHLPAQLWRRSGGPGRGRRGGTRPGGHVPRSPSLVQTTTTDPVLHADQTSSGPGDAVTEPALPLSQPHRSSQRSSATPPRGGACWRRIGWAGRRRHHLRHVPLRTARGGTPTFAVSDVLLGQGQPSRRHTTRRVSQGRVPSGRWATQTCWCGPGERGDHAAVQRYATAPVARAPRAPRRPGWRSWLWVSAQGAAGTT